VLEPIDALINGIDLRSNAERAAVYSLIDDRDPDVIMIAPPCAPWSMLQNIMPRNIRLRERKKCRLLAKRKKDRPLWLMTQKLMRRTLKKNNEKFNNKRNRICIVENPEGSLAWKTFAIPGTDARVDQCCFDLKLHKSVRTPGRKIRKRTKFRTTNAQLSTLLHAECGCRCSNPKHDHIESGDKVNGRWTSRSEYCCAWTDKLANHILSNCEKTLGFEQMPLHEFGPVSSEQPGDYLCYPAAVDPESEFDQPQEPQEQQEQQEQGEQQEQQEQQEQGEQQEQFDREVVRAVRKLHERYGHPGTDAFVRALRTGGATASAIAYAKQMTCPVCERVQRPKDPHQTATRRTDEVNQSIGVDLLWIHDCADNQYFVLSIVDQATTFQVARILATKTSKEIAAVLEGNWTSIFQEPREVVFDHGTEFRKEFTQLLENMGTRATVFPVEAHWKGGVTERHGGILKTIVRKLCEAHNVSNEDDMRIVIAEACAAKNSLSRRGGFSPIQWVLGYERSLPSSLLDNPDKIAVHSNIQIGGSFAKRANIRETARHVWIELDNSDRHRRALLRQPRINRTEYHPGELCFFYQLRDANRATRSKPDDPRCWKGPCVVVATQGLSTVWLSWNQSLIKAAVEQLRPASEDETMGSEMISQELAIQRAVLGG
jgi:hypothetical protein